MEFFHIHCLCSIKAHTVDILHFWILQSRPSPLCCVTVTMHSSLQHVKIYVGFCFNILMPQDFLMTRQKYTVLSIQQP